MESEKYKEFLKLQAKHNPVKIEGSVGGGRFRISWEDDGERPASSRSSDILDSLYLGKGMKETVIVDHRVAALLRDRLRGLEDENIYMRRRIRFMKLAIVTLLAAVASVSILLVIYLPHMQAIL